MIQQIQILWKMEKLAIIGNLDAWCFYQKMAILNHIIHISNSSVAKWNSFLPNFLNSDDRAPEISITGIYYVSATQE